MPKRFGGAGFIFEETPSLIEALETTLSDYERERGKPLPSFSHSCVQASNAANAGVKSCWIVGPAIGTIAVFTRPSTCRSFANGSSVVDELLGVEIPLADIFS